MKEPPCSKLEELAMEKSQYNKSDSTLSKEEHHEQEQWDTYRDQE